MLHEDIYRLCVRAVQRTRSNAIEIEDLGGVLRDEILSMVADSEVPAMALKWSKTLNPTPMDAMNAVQYMKFNEPYSSMLLYQMTFDNIDEIYYHNPNEILRQAIADGISPD